MKKTKTYPSNRGKPHKAEAARFKTKNIALNAPGYRMVQVNGKTWKQVKIEVE